MRIVHTADWHIGRMLYEYSLIEDQMHFANSLEKFLIEAKADVLIIAGDVFDKSVPSTEAVKLLDDILYNLIANIGIAVFIVAGNHDNGKRLGYCSRLYKETGLHIVGEYSGKIEKVTLKDNYGNVNFFMLPYLQPTDVRQYFSGEKIKTYDDAYKIVLENNKIQLNLKERNIMVAHGFFSPIGNISEKSIITSDSEVSVGGADIADAGYFDEYDYTALGHLHSPQDVVKNTVRYSGSPLKYSLSEAGRDKSLTVIDIYEKGRISINLKSIKPLHDLVVLKDSFDNLLNSACLLYTFSEPTRLRRISYAVFCLKKKKQNNVTLLLLQKIEKPDISI